MKKPVKPKKPEKIIKITECLYLYDGTHYSLEELFDMCNNHIKNNFSNIEQLTHKDIYIYQDANEYNDPNEIEYYSPSAVHVCFNVTRENKNYDAEISKYNKKLKIYTQKYKEWKDRYKQESIDATKKQIESLQKTLKELED